MCFADPPWTEKEIVFVESMSDQTNAYHVSFVEQVSTGYPFGTQLACLYAHCHTLQPK